MSSVGGHESARDEDLHDAHREGFGAGVEWADKDRDKAFAAAWSQGYDRAVANLRDEAKWREWRRALRAATPDAYVPGSLTDAERNGAADYLEAEATKETDR